MAMPEAGKQLRPFGWFRLFATIRYAAAFYIVAFLARKRRRISLLGTLAEVVGRMAGLHLLAAIRCLSNLKWHFRNLICNGWQRRCEKGAHATQRSSCISCINRLGTRSQLAP